MKLRVWEKMLIVYAVLLSTLNTALVAAGVRSIDVYISIDTLAYFTTIAIAPTPRRASRRITILSVIMILLFALVTARRVIAILRG